MKIEQRFNILERFYNISELRSDNDTIDAVIVLNPGHAVFQGHFPGRPVVPGVCLIQITREIVGRALHEDFDITEASNVKFLQVVDPGKTQKLNFHADITREEQIIRIKASFSGRETVYFKINAIFTKKF